MAIHNSSRGPNDASPDRGSDHQVPSGEEALDFNFREVLRLLRKENEQLRKRIADIFDDEADWVIPSGPAPGTTEPLTRLQQRILRILYLAKGKTVRRESLYNLLYQHRVDSEMPAEGSVAVMLSRIRVYLRHTPWEIETNWGVGWKLCRRSRSRLKRVDNRNSTAKRTR